MEIKIEIGVNLLKAVGRVVEEKEPDCAHVFFKCRVPAGDSCVAIYHDVCKKCRWDKRKGIVMPDDIWNGWAVPQLKKKEEVVSLIPKMFHYYWREDDEIVVQNWVNGMKGQEHRHSPKDFEDWVKENKIKPECLMDLDFFD